MFKHYFELIDGVANYPIFSLLVFFVFFVALGIWVFTMKKEVVEKIRRIPLEESNEA
jgi:hypothetical protein